MEETLVRVSKAAKHREIPFASSTLYKWAHIHKYPDLFVKIGGALFVDLVKLREMIEQGRQSTRIANRPGRAS